MLLHAVACLLFLSLLHRSHFLTWEGRDRSEKEIVATRSVSLSPHRPAAESAAESKNNAATCGWRAATHRVSPFPLVVMPHPAMMGRMWGET